MKSFFREIFWTIVLAVIIFLLMQATIQSSIVDGPSMENSFYHGERLIIAKDRIVYLLNEPQRGDIIVFHSPQNHKEEYLKRIIGLPGDSIEIKEGTVYINGTRLDEPYIKDTPGYTYRNEAIPEDTYFVLGDNRNNSNDSHNDWFVPRHDIVGKVVFSVWPPPEWGPAPNYPLDEQLLGS